MIDKDICIHRFKYDTVHLNDTIFDLDEVAGDTSFREWDLNLYQD